MIKARLKYCIEDRGRWYLRKPGRRKIRIRVELENANGGIRPEFMTAYFEALAKLYAETSAPPNTPREKTFYWLVDQYYRSAKFTNFNRLTQADKRSVLVALAESGATAAELCAIFGWSKLETAEI